MTYSTRSLHILISLLSWLLVVYILFYGIIWNYIDIYIYLMYIRDPNKRNSIKKNKNTFMSDIEHEKASI